LAEVQRIIAARAVLIAVSKMHPAEAVAEAYALGQRDFGENYAQELAAKAEALKTRCPELRWHFIGRLQKNKINMIAPHVFAWHTVDSFETAEALAKRAPGAQVLVQVNVAREAQKGGVLPEAVSEVVAACGALSLRGLMTIHPAEGNPAPHFRALAQLRDTHVPGGWLSMGMSHDFAEAIACGATHVRVGTAIFGAR
jgi:pyridoxal phosphate enzyme (YggS family)